MPLNGKDKDESNKSLSTDYDKRLHSVCLVVINKDLRRIADKHLTLGSNQSVKESFLVNEDPDLDEVSAFVDSSSRSRKRGLALLSESLDISSNKTDSVGSKSGSGFLKHTSFMKTMEGTLRLFKKDEIFKNWKAQNLQRCDKCEGEFEDLASHSLDCPANNSMLQGSSFRTFEVTNKPDELKCLMCGKTFLKKIHLALHQKIHARMDKKVTRPRANPTKKFSCRVCQISFNSNDDLLDHYSVFHAGNLSHFGATPATSTSNFDCPLCQRAFPSKSRLDAHLNTCGNSYTFEGQRFKVGPLLESDFHVSLFQHLGNSTESTQYIAVNGDGHDREVNSKSGDQVHDNVINNSVQTTEQTEVIAEPSHQDQPEPIQKRKAKMKPKFTCKECGKRFFYQSFLDFHLKSHSKTEEVFSCKRCQKTFSSQDLFKSHLLIHKFGKSLNKTEAELPFICANSACSCRFSELSDLSIHIENVHFANNYALCCEVCGKESSSTNTLNNHRLNDHCLSAPTYFYINEGKVDDSVPEPFILLRKDDKVKAEGIAKGEKKENRLSSPSGRGKFRVDIPYQDVYSCSLCDKKFNLRNLYMIHLSVHKREDQNRCHICQKGFLTAEQLKSHIKRHDDPDYNPNARGRMREDIPIQDVYNCTICEREFPIRSHYISHMNMHERTEQYKCHLCPLKFMNDDQLQRHIPRHSDPNYVPGRRIRSDIPHQSMYTCETCGRKIKKRNIYLSHIAMHKREEKYTCKECGRKFQTETLYLEHLERHNDPNYDPTVKRGRFREDIPFQDEYTCEDCSKVYTDRKMFLIHVSIHRREEKYTCADCGRKFQSELPYLEHLDRHKDPNYDPNIMLTRGRGRVREDIPIQDEYSCDKCYKVFKVRQLFIGHLSMHAREEKYACNICEKKCLNKFLLEDHMKRHEDPNYKFIPRKRERARLPKQNFYTCELCGKKFNKRAGYNAHMFYHRRILEETFKCDLCNRAFSSQQILDDHIKRHEDPNFRPRKFRSGIPDQDEYTCTTCDAKFKEKKEYRVHLLSHPSSPGKSFFGIKRTGRRGRVDVPVQDEYNCKYCSKLFVNRTKYLMHLRYQHPESHNVSISAAGGGSHVQHNFLDKQFECEDCLKRFKTKIVRDIHKQKYCKKIPCKYKCGRCADRFHNKKTLARHFERWHAAAIQVPLAEVELSCRQCSQTFNTQEGLDRHVTLYHPTTDITFNHDVCSGVAEMEESGENDELGGDLGENWGDDDLPMISSFCETEITENNYERVPEATMSLSLQKSSADSCNCKLKKKKFCHNMQCSCVRLKKLCDEGCGCDDKCLNSTDKERDQQETFKKSRLSVGMEQEDSSPTSNYSNSPSTQQEQEELFVPPATTVDLQTFPPPPPEPHVTQPSLRIVQSEFISVDAATTDESLRQLSFEGYVEGDEDPLNDPLCEAEESVTSAPTISTTTTVTQSLPSTITSSQSYHPNRTYPPKHYDHTLVQPSRSVPITPAASAATATVSIGSKTLQTPIATLEKSLDSFGPNSSIMCQICKKNFNIIPNFMSHILIHKQFHLKFHCSVCSKQMSGILDFLRHVDTHNKGLILQCSKCNSKFKSYSDLKKHQQVYHSRPMECGVCEVKFPDSQGMMTHWSKAHPTCQCGLCLVKFFSYDDLTWHMRSLHSTYDCCFCGTREKKLEFFLNHLQTHHGVTSFERPAGPLYNIKCNYCALLFSSHEELDYHVTKNHHEVISTASSTSAHQGYSQSNIKCIYCGLSCSNEKELNDHVKDHHKVSSTVPSTSVRQGHSQYNIKCSYCGLLFSSHEELNEHLVNHMASRAMSEQSSGVVLNDATLLQERFTKHLMDSSQSINPSPSPSSPETTTNYNINDNTQAVEVLTCPSPNCLKLFTQTFANRAAWIRHIRQYHANIIFCSDCYSLFESSEELKQHLRNSRCKVLLCKECPSNFSCKKNLYAHVKKCHSALELPPVTVSSGTPVSIASRQSQSTQYLLLRHSEEENSNVVSVCNLEVEEIVLD